MPSAAITTPPFALAGMNAPLENGLSAVRKRLGGPVGRNAPIPLRRFDASFQRLGMASNAPVTDIANKFGA